MCCSFFAQDADLLAQLADADFHEAVLETILKSVDFDSVFKSGFDKLVKQTMKKLGSGGDKGKFKENFIDQHLASVGQRLRRHPRKSVSPTKKRGPRRGASDDDDTEYSPSKKRASSGGMVVSKLATGMNVLIHSETKNRWIDMTIGNQSDDPTFVSLNKARKLLKEQQETGTELIRFV